MLVGDPLLWDQDTSKNMHGVLQDKDTVFDVREITKFMVEPIPTSLCHTTQTQHVHNYSNYSKGIAFYTCSRLFLKSI